MVGNKLSNKESYFLFIIIFTKKPANKKSYFLAFFSSFPIFATFAQAFFLDSLYFSLAFFAASADCQPHSDDSISGIKSSIHISYR
jgi:hypothetical protein